MPETNKDPALKLARGVVAARRNIVVPTSEKRIAGYSADGKPVYKAVQRSAGPGEEIELPAHEIAHLRAAGFLTDPDAPVAERGAGPRFERP